MVDPKPGSALAQADAFYEWEKASIWVRNYLCAAAEHLCLWADVTAAYKLHPEAINEVRPRPYLLLARAGLKPPLTRCGSLWFPRRSNVRSGTSA